MPTPSERRALLFVAAVAALGLGVRGVRGLRAAGADPDGKGALVAQIAAVDSAVTAGGRPRRRAAPPRETQRASAGATTSADTRLRSGGLPQPPRRSATPDAPPSPVDVDRATAEELDALPGIGPALAARIVEDRAQHGEFGSLEALQEVRGIGPALAAKLAPFVTFSAPPRAPRATTRTPRSSHP